MTTTKGIRALAFGLALGVAAPAMGAAHDTTTDRAHETTAKVKRKARAAKPGGESASDRWADTKDYAKEKSAKARRQGRTAAHDTNKSTKRAEQRAHDRVNDATR